MNNRHTPHMRAKPRRLAVSLITGLLLAATCFGGASQSAFAMGTASGHDTTPPSTQGGSMHTTDGKSTTQTPIGADLPNGQNPTTQPLGALAGSYDLAQSGTYTISSVDSTDAAFHAIETKAYPGPPGGITANSLIWTGFLRQAGRTIIVKLAQPSTLTHLSMQCYQNTSMGILFPGHIQFSVSANGLNWYNAGDIGSPDSPYDEGKLEETYQVGLNDVSAQYVRVQFPVDVWVLARNLRILGSPLIAPTTTILPQAPLQATYPGYVIPSEKTTAGVSNMLLVYSGANGALGTWTPKQFLPMVAYTSPSGQVDGKMFDSFLFLPYGSLLTSVGGWSHYLNNLFQPGQQLSALNETVAKVAPQLKSFGISEPTVNVVLAIPYPNSAITDFGSLPGTTNNLTFSAAQVGNNTADADRKAAIEWYVQALLARFHAAHFAHLKLVGLYWDSESVVYTAPLELNLIQKAVQLTNDAGLKLFWIPTFEAAGLINWSEFGFNDVMVQSNYFETPSLPIDRVTEAASEAFDQGLGMEIELGQSALMHQSDRDRYFNQLVADNLSGIEGDVLHSFYDGSQILTQAAYSNDASIHDLYVDTYDFLINQFTYRSYIVY